MIRAENLTKRYGQHVAIDSLNFNIEKGEILGFLGPNGAGKSTTMNIITGYLSASDGRVLVNDLDVLEHPSEVKKMIGYLPEQPPLYLEMTVLEYLKFVGEIKSVPKLELKADLDRIMELVKIADVSQRLIRNLSKGYRQRVGLAQALIGNPELLILDEPTIGLDPKQIIEMRNLIKSLGKEHTIVLSSHILPEISAVCQRVLIINKGKIAASDTPENLSQRIAGKNRLSLRVEGPSKEVKSRLSSLDGIKSVDVTNSNEENAVDVLIEAEKNRDLRREVFKAMSKADYPILMMRPMDMSLEDIFLQLTTTETQEVS
ncbi:MAG TPA: ATP-binding cassette domain-containing protein [Spirochaetia bacterium]|nr:ATP-binding cassette domain-containing protein [Spirochaetia bacterium]